MLPMRFFTASTRKVTLGLCLLGGTALFAFNSPSERYFDIAKNLDIFATLYKELNTYYVDEVNPNKAIKTGIDAMLGSLDPYTNYIPEDEIEDYRFMTTGQYGGIGAVIAKRKDHTLVIMPNQGFPADKAGLKIGDEILEIDGIDLVKKNNGDVSKLLKGQAGTVVKLKIKRFGKPDPIMLEITRARIKVDNVPTYALVTPEIGYVKLSDFMSEAGKDVRKAVVELKEKGAKKIILDLRDNPGGLLNEAVNVCNLFVPKDKEVVTTKGKVAEWNKTYRALNPPLDTDIPIVVLTNSRSASASEIVSGTLQDYDRGVLIGQRTFGKGLVQATRPLTYNSQLKITTAKYYIPSGRCIQAIDYSHRNEDGSVGKIPDSLKQTFKTVSGRLVYDGGGVAPDIVTEKQTVAPITIGIESKGLFFDYATEYYWSHPTIAAPQAFQLTNAEMDAFYKWLADKDFDYTTKVEASIKDLETHAKKEQSYDAIKDQLESLRKKLSHSKEQDLVKFREEVKEVLEANIVSRYYFERGALEAGFDNDTDIQAAVKLLNNPAEYGAILKGRK